MNGITYNFFKEELYSIDIDVQGTGNVRKLLKILEKQYGKHHTLETHTYPKTSAELEIREWAGKGRIACTKARRTTAARAASS